MIVAAKGQKLRLITQNDHAHFAAELLSLWIRDRMPDHPRRREILFAAREHDNGWQETDSAPLCNPATGRPYDFIDLPQPERRRLWHRGLHRFAGREPYAAALIVRHALQLHQSRADDPEWGGTLREWRSLEADLLEASATTAAEVDEDYPQIDLADFFSLLVCCATEQPFERHGYRVRAQSNQLFIDPFPLAGTTTFTIQCRLVEDRAYRGDTDLAVSMASASWEKMKVQVCPFE